MHKNNFIRLFLMLSLLVPIGLVTVWGASHARPNLAWLKICINNGNTYVLGKHYLKQDSMLTCLNATTGEYKSLRLPGQSEFYPLSIGFDGEELWTLEGSRQGQHQIWVVSVPGLSIKVKSTIEDASTDGGICVVGSCVIQIQSDVVTVEAMGTQTKTDAMNLGFASDGTLQQISGTWNVLAYEKTKTMGAVRDFALLSVRDGKVTQVARWKAIDCRVNDEHAPKYLTSLLPDGATVETLDATDGKVYCSKSLPDDFGLRLPLVSNEDQLTTNWINWKSGGMNVLTGATSKSPGNAVVIWHDVVRQRLFCVKSFEFYQKNCTVLDEQTGHELFRFQMPVPYYQADIQVLEDQLLVATRDGRIYFYDVVSGTLLRSIDPFRSVHWVNCICGVVFLAWCVLWSRLATRIHSKGWLDLFAYTMPILGYVAVRLHDQVADRFSSHAISLVSYGISLGLALLASIWWAIGGVRWSLGALPLALCILFGIGFHSFTEGSGMFKPFANEAFVLTSLAATCFLMLLKFGSYRFCHDSTDRTEIAHVVSETNRHRFPLRDLFLYTAVFGILFAMLKGNLCIMALDPSLLLIAVPSGLFFAFVASVALWLANYCSDLIAVRVARLSCGITLLCVLFADPAGLMFFPPILVSALGYASFLFFLMPVWLTVYFGLYAYRLRGWRIATKTPCLTKIASPSESVSG